MSVADSLGGVAASQAFTFYTNATRYDPAPNQSNLDSKVGGAEAQSCDGGWLGVMNLGGCRSGRICS